MNKWPSISSACLLVIVDQYEQNYNYFSYILKYINTKLNDCSISLKKSFFITSQDQKDLLNQFDYLIKNHSNDFIFVTTTNDQMDDSMLNLCNQLSLNRTNLLKNGFDNGIDLDCYESRVILIRKKYFHLELSKFFYLLLRSYFNETKFYLNLNNNDSLIENIKNITHEQILGNDYIIKNKNIIIKKLFSNYNQSNKFIFEIILLNRENICLNNYLKDISSKQSIQFSDLMLDNFINADSYLYDFDKYFKYLIDYNMNNKSIIETRPDLKFLLEKKIDLNEFISKLSTTIKIIEDGLARYSQDQTCVSFNGGKDCCVVLYLYYAVALRSKYEHPINVLYIKIDNQFEEMDYFIDHVIPMYYKSALNFITFDDTSKTLKDCLKELKIINPRIQSVLMGTRRTDSDYFKNMSVFAPTDGDWPSYMRINPILDWSFSEIWFFIRLFKLPYCSLYDKGFTSIDNSLNTIPNKALLVDEVTSTYLPAYFLESQDLERHSRVKIKK
jgi:3'-phosphoadenosine 5'-phosphosulfate sulfotransferase (PAPS reductase)/FAD synthetase